MSIQERHSANNADMHGTSRRGPGGQHRAPTAAAKWLMYFSLLLLGMGTGISHAGNWASPIDKKYQARNPQLFQTFSTARATLDSWRGQGDKLRHAASLLQEVIESDDQYAPAYREVGRLYIMAGYINRDNFKDGSLPPSEAYILQSIEIEPEYADAYVLLGHLYTKMKRYDDAEQALKQGEHIGTESPWLQLNWADLLKKRGQYDQAMARYQNVVKTGSDNRKAYAGALSGVTTMHRKMKQYDKANQSFLAEIDYQPDDAWIWGNYASFLLYSYNDVDEAIRTGRKALSIRDYGMGRFTLGSALYTKWAMLKDDPATAEAAGKYFDEAWSLFPNPDAVIDETSRHQYTKITAAALKDWSARQGSSAGKGKRRPVD